MECRTFGEFLKIVMNKRKLSASKLAVLTGNKSKTTVIRLLNDDCGTRAVMKFAENLPEVLKLTEKEIECMRYVLSLESLLPAEKKVMANLLTLFEKNEPNFSGKVCTAYNSKKINKKMPLENIFKDCADQNCIIIIESVVSPELASALDNLIHLSTQNGYSPVINHFFKSDECIDIKGMQLMSVMKLSTYLGYNAFECHRNCTPGKNITILIEQDNKFSMRRIKFADDDTFHYTDTAISEILYHHILYEQELLINNSVPLRSKPVDKNNLEPMLTDLQKYDILPSMQINSSVSYMMIPFKIQKHLFEKSNYLGLGKEHPYIQRLYSIMESRANILENYVTERKVIWTIDGLRSFLKNGKAGDHFRPFAALSTDEAAETLTSFIDRKGVHCKILKNDFSVYDTEFIVYENLAVMIYDPIWGWWDNFTTANISDRRMINLAFNFYNNVLWEKCCFTEDESKKIIYEMIEISK